MKKLVIFDLDGTLLNSITDLGIAANYALEKNGYKIHPIETYVNFVGNGVRKLIERAMPEEERSKVIVDSLLVDFKRYYSVHKTDNTKLYEGISGLVTDLNEMGVKMAIASNKYQEATEGIINHFFPDIAFAAIEGQKPDFPTKPDPSVIFSILGIAEIKKCETLYVGDSGVDMETAWRACVDSVGVTWGFRKENELRERHATFIATEPSQILDIVREINLINYYNK